MSEELAGNLISPAKLEVLTSESHRHKTNGSSFTGTNRSTFQARFSTVESAPERPSSVTAIDFKELDDGTFVELVQHPEDPERTSFALWKDGTVRYEEKLEVAGRTLVPTPKCGNLLKQIRLPRSPQPYGSVLDLARRILNFLKRYVALEEAYLRVLMHFVLSTWVADRLPVAVYLSLIGLPQTGKTTLLRVLNQICRRRESDSHAYLLATECLVRLWRSAVYPSSSARTGSDASVDPIATRPALHGHPALPHGRIKTGNRSPNFRTRPGCYRVT